MSTQVKTLQNACFSVVGLALFAGGLQLVKKYFLHSSWRWMLALTTIFLNFIDMPFTFLTIFNVVRNQYFYLGETVSFTKGGSASAEEGLGQVRRLRLDVRRPD